MDVQILDLDKAYLTSEELSQYIKENAQKISNDLRITIGNIKIHWKGEDATNHINAWINNYDKVSHHFQELYVISRYLQNYFVIIQTGRNRISEKKGIGTPNTDIYEFNPIQKIDGTSEYYYDEQLKTDHIALQETYNQLTADKERLNNELLQAKQEYDELMQMYELKKNEDAQLRNLYNFHFNK